jgi:hypothetical protein
LISPFLMSALVRGIIAQPHRNTTVRSSRDLSR